jgi:hypothetical protein
MSYTLAQAVTQVRYLINEESADFWSDTEIEEWIKQATITLSTTLLSAETESTVTMASNQFVYSSSDEAWLADLLKVKAAYYTDGSSNVYGMQRIELDMFGHTMHFQSTGRPIHYYESNRKFYVCPKPGTTEVGDAITVLHSYETDAIANLRDEHQPLTFLYAASKAKSKDRQHQEAALYMTQFMGAINFERQDKYDMGVAPTQTLNVP